MIKASPKILMIGPVPYVLEGISVSAGNLLSSKLKDSFDIHYISSRTAGTKIAKLAIFLKALIELSYVLFTDSHQLAHIHVSSYASFYRKLIFVLILKLFGRKIIVHLHGSEFEKFVNSDRLNRILVRKVFDLVDLILVLTAQWQKTLHKMTSNPNIKILYNSIDTEKYNNTNKTRNHEEKIILFMGRLGERKGVYDLVDAVPLILKKYPKVRFVLCGNGEVEQVKELCEKKNIGKNVHLPGWVSGSDKISYYCAAYIYTLPSYYEGLPMAILEAMAAGLPIIATNAGGMAEVIKDGENGFIVKAGDKMALANKIMQLLDDEVLSFGMGKKNSDKAQKTFDVEVISTQLAHYYETLLCTTNFN